MIKTINNIAMIGAYEIPINNLSDKPLSIESLHKALTDQQKYAPEKSCSSNYLKIAACPTDESLCEICAFDRNNRLEVLKIIKKESIRKLNG